jgi:hypothetical protein
LHPGHLSTNGMTLQFTSAPTNATAADLGIELAAAGSAYQARLGFHRTDQPAPLDWSVVTTLSLSAR